MPEDISKNYRGLVESYYDIQKERILVENRMRAYTQGVSDIDT